VTDRTHRASRGEWRSIPTVLVDEPAFQALSSDARLLLLILRLTCGASGIACIPGLAVVLEERSGIHPDDVGPALQELEYAQFIRRERNVVWVVEVLATEPNLRVTDAKHRKGIRGHIAGLPALGVVRAFVDRYREWFQASDGPWGSLGWLFPELGRERFQSPEALRRDLEGSSEGLRSRKEEEEGGRKEEEGGKTLPASAAAEGEEGGAAGSEDLEEAEDLEDGTPQEGAGRVLLALGQLTTEQASPSGTHPEEATDVGAEEPPADQGPKRKPHVYAPDFEAAWKDYPARGPGGGHSKKDAEKAWNAQKRRGATAGELHAGVRRYKAYCDATKKTGTDYVKHMSTFLGPSDHWEEKWDIPPGTTPPAGGPPSPNGTAPRARPRDLPLELIS
jgi:hypothetical protein